MTAPHPTPADVVAAQPNFAEKITEATAAADAPTPEPVATAPEAAPSTEPNVWENPELAKAEIERLRKENAKDRTTAKQTAADEARTEFAQTIGKALGLVKDEAPVDPAALTEQLTTSQAEAQRVKVENAVLRNAAAAGADPAALLDSASFQAKVAALDPTDTAAISAAITEHVEANPRLKAAPATRAPAPNPAQGSSASGASGVTQRSAEWVQQMTSQGRHADIVKAREAGELANYLSS